MECMAAKANAVKAMAKAKAAFRDQWLRGRREDILDVHPYVDAAASSTVPPTSPQPPLNAQSSAVDTARTDQRLTPQATQAVPPPPPPHEARSATASFRDIETERCFFLCFIAVFTATLMQTVQLSGSAIAVFTATLRTCFCCYTQPLRFNKQNSFSRWEKGILEKLDEHIEQVNATMSTQRISTLDEQRIRHRVGSRTAELSARVAAAKLQAIHPLIMVAVFTARLRKRSEIVAVFTAKCWELLACGFHRQCTRVGFR